jgi:hypothetical protein
VSESVATIAMEDSSAAAYCDLIELKREAKELIFETDTWEPFSDSDGIKAETKYINGSDIKMIR